MSELHGIPFKRAGFTEEVVRLANVLTLATSSMRPIIDGDLIKSGCHINCIGSYCSAMRELEDKSVLKSRINADQKLVYLAEAGDFIIPMKNNKFK